VPDRFPAVWSNGVITPLPIPPGYAYAANLQNYKINYSGTVAGSVQAPDGTYHVVLWENGNPTVIEPPASLFPGCSGPAGSLSYALNSAGHILIFTVYPNDPSFNGYLGPCTAFWAYPAATRLRFPTPPQCTGLPVNGGHPLTYAGSPPVAMNDADQVVENIENLYCGPPYVNPAPIPTYDPAVIQASGSFAFLPANSLTFAGAVGAEATEINNVGDVHGFESDLSGQTTVVIWDSAGVHVLGPSPSGYASLNNVGQVLYASAILTPSQQWAIWQNGVSTPIQLPPGLAPTGGPYGGLNDAGQFTASDGGNFYLATPSGACGQDVTSQVQVTRGGFRLNHSTGHFTQTVTVTNTGGFSIAGPISLALDNVPANATLFGISGATLCDPPQGSPYMNLAAASLDPDVPVAGTVEFIDTANTGITYNARVLAGPRGR
jgi:hypothetical protein